MTIGCCICTGCCTSCCCGGGCCCTGKGFPASAPPLKKLVMLDCWGIGHSAGPGGKNCCCMTTCSFFKIELTIQWVPLAQTLKATSCKTKHCELSCYTPSAGCTGGHRCSIIWGMALPCWHHGLALFLIGTGYAKEMEGGGANQMVPRHTAPANSGLGGTSNGQVPGLNASLSHTKPVRNAQRTQSVHTSKLILFHGQMPVHNFT